VADRQHKHRDLWVGLAVGLIPGGLGLSLGVWAAEQGTARVGFWPHAGEIAGVALCALGVFLAVAVVRGWWLPGGFQGEPAVPIAQISPPVDPALWKTRVDESGDHTSMGFQLEYRLSDRLTVTKFTRLRVTVIDPGDITTSAEGLGRIYEYPREFPDAPPIRSGTYRFKWEGRDDKGGWRDITRGTHEVEME
jgi:hypothetical protein